MPNEEEDELQPEATGIPEITRDITGETHLHSVIDPEADVRMHRVREGDTLRKLAIKFYGDEDEFNRIIEANRDRLGDNDELIVGSELRIPLDE
jgi:nucleoid-associated protein YgaU